MILGHCQACGRPVIFATTLDGRSIALDPRPRSKGRWVVDWQALPLPRAMKAPAGWPDRFRDHTETCSWILHRGPQPTYHAATLTAAEGVEP